MDSASKWISNVKFAVACSAIGCFSYYCRPWIEYGVQEVVFCLEWFRWILSYCFIVFFVVGVVVFAIICLVDYFKPQGKEQDEDKLDEYVSTMSTTVRPSRPEYSYNNNNYRVTEVDNDRYYNNRNNNNSSYYMENNIVPAYEPVRTVEERYERTRTEEKKITMTRSEEKKKKKKDKKDKVTMEYRRTESERMTKYESCMSPSFVNVGFHYHTCCPNLTCCHHGLALFCGLWGHACCLRPLNLVMGVSSSAPGFRYYGAQHGQNGGTPYQAIDQWQCGPPRQARAIDQWGYNEPQRQNGVVMMPLEEERNGRHHSRRHHRVGGSGYGPDGSYLAISN